MTKKELKSAVADRAGVTKKVGADVVDALIDVITETLAKGEDVAITGFGQFKVKEIAQSKALNPQNGQEILVPAHKRASFKVGTQLKAAVR